MLVNTWCELSRYSIQEGVAGWLSKPQVLTAALKQHCHKLKVRLLNQFSARLAPDEKKLMSVAEDEAWVRQIYLTGDGEPWTYGRVVVAQSTYLAYKDQFDALGDKPLGETLLYNNPAVRRSSFQVKPLFPNDPLYKSALQGVKERPRRLWARRSVFRIDDKPLLVIEVFLPKLPAWA